MGSPDLSNAARADAPSRTSAVRRSVTELVRAARREPFTARARRELLSRLIGVAFGALGLVVIVAMLVPGTAVSAIRGGVIFAGVLVALVASGAARRLGSLFRRLAVRLMGVRVVPPPDLRVEGGILDRARARLRDGVSWRATAYVLIKLPMAALDLYAITAWLGAIDLTYPLWWRLFRNHPPNVRLSPAWFLTPLGGFRVGSFAGTFLVFAIGAVEVLAAPWVTRGVTWLDARLVRGLLGSSGLAERVRALEQTRTRVVDDAAAALRRIERDLHDGTQAQLATLAMRLGQAKEKLEPGSEIPVDPTGALELLDAAHRQAKETLVELRDIARGIHPPALDVGLEAALTTLVARSAVPTLLRIDMPTRPSQAIETIAYFSAAELLANVARHSQAQQASVDVTGRDGRLRVRVTDDGVGGARLDTGSGLRGLAERAEAVDGGLTVASPSGGPTEVTIDLPLHA